MTARIVSVTGRQIWDSRGRPTVEAEVVLEGGAIGRAIAPAGASRGAHEAIDLRDGGEAFGGFGVNKAVSGIGREIAPALIGLDAREQAAIDRVLCDLDGTPNKARLGANAVVAVSLAVLHAAADHAREHRARGELGDLELERVARLGRAVERQRHLLPGHYRAEAAVGQGALQGGEEALAGDELG